MSDRDDPVDVHVDFVKRETAKAYLFEIDGDEAWIAKSQIIDDPGLSPGDENVTITVPTWIAEENGWA